MKNIINIKKEIQLYLFFACLILLQIGIAIPKVFASDNQEPEIVATLNTATPNPAKTSDQITVNYNITPTKILPVILKLIIQMIRK